MKGGVWEVTVETGGREDRLLTWDRVRPIAGISRTTAWRMAKAGDFPEPVPISPKRVGWWESELTAWKASRLNGARPKPLVPARKPKFIETARSTRPSREVVASPPQATAPALPQTVSEVVAPEQTSPEAPACVAAPEPEQAVLPLEPSPAPARGSARPGRRKARVSPDQIDFGF